MANINCTILQKKLELSFSHVDILWITPEDEQSYRTNPNGLAEVRKTGSAIIRTVCKVAVGLCQQSIALQGKRMVAGQYFDLDHIAIVGEVAAQFVGTPNHRKVMGCEWPAGEVHIPHPVVFTVE